MTNYFYCNLCKRYYLDVFESYHDKKHKYLVFNEKKQNFYNFDETYTPSL
jgi:hypothetical protein